MGWPTTKATTTALDSGSDNPNTARPQIKQNIDNVNTIIDNFTISSPNDKSILSYSSSLFATTRAPLFEATLRTRDGQSFDGSGNQYEVLSSGSGGAEKRSCIWDEVIDDNNFVGLNSMSTGIILQPGKYFWQVLSKHRNSVYYYYPEEYYRPNLYWKVHNGDNVAYDWKYFGEILNVSEGTTYEDELYINAQNITLPGNITVGNSTASDIFLKIIKFE